MTEFGFSIKNYNETPHKGPAKKRIPVYNFLRRTAEGEDVKKAEIREQSLAFVLKFFKDNNIKKIRSLTLPGITWLFEKKLKSAGWIQRERKELFKISMTGCEVDYKVFCISASNIPRRDNSKVKLNPYYSDNLKSYVVCNTKQSIYLLNVDIYHLLSQPINEEKRYPYNFIWFDTTGTYRSFINRLPFQMRYWLSEKTVVMVTILNGRDNANGEQRISSMNDAMGAFGLSLQKEIRYFDTCSMLHLIYSK